MNMPRVCRVLVLLLAFVGLLPPALPAAEEIPREELWYVLEMLGERSGYMQVETGPVTFGETSAVESRVRLYNAVSRRNGGIRERVVITSRTRWVEDLEGRTLLVEQELEQGAGAASSTRLEVRGETAHLTVSTGETGPAGERHLSFPWDEAIVGQRSMEQEVDRVLRGEVREARVHTFSLEAGGRVLEVRVRLVERREDGSAVVEQEMVELGITTVEEYDGDGTLVRQEVGPVVLRLASREEALAPLEESLEAFERVSVHLDRSPEAPRQLRRAAYRLVPRPSGEGLKLASLFVEDHRQRIERRPEGDVLWVEVPAEGKRPAASEIDTALYLAPSSLIESDDPAIRAVAHEVTAATADPPPSRREQAERLERWVREHVHYSGSGVGLATAGQTFRSRDGDCTENAFLLTALMRAAGIPARVVVGLVYAGGGGSGGGAEEKPRPALVPHAWVEAHLEDGWRAFDSAVYSSPVDATHLAMAKSAGQEEGALLEVTVPLLSALGHFDLEWVDLTPPAAGR